MSNRRSHNIGEAAKRTNNSNVEEIEADFGFLKLSSPIESVVRASYQKESDDVILPSYAIENSFNNRRYRQSNNVYDFGELIVKIDPVNCALTFQNKEGETINEDDTFSVSWIGEEIYCYKKIQENEKFIGLGEKTGGLDRKGKAFVNWNTDKFAYSAEDDPLYASFPFYMGIHNGLCYGIFLDNTSKTTFNFGASTNRFMYFSAQNGVLDYYFIHGKSISEIILKYNQLTGTIALPPIWSLGLQQCRYSYYPDTEVLNIAQNFRDRKIPADMIYLDIHYMDEYKVFTFDKERFPDPEGLTKKLKAQNFELAVIVDPGVKKAKGYSSYDDGKQKGIFVNYPDGENYTANVWPGESCFPDFTNPKARDWWANQFDFYTTKGITGFWNDMNEPASWGQHTPDLIEFDFEGNKVAHKDARNVFGMQMSRATFEGTKKALNGKRPFILTRAGYSGIQRYSAVWTGDNMATNEHMLLGVRLLNSLSISGVPFCGYDVGGFAEEATPALFARWIILGAFSPMFRCHSMINSRDAEPWAFGEEAEAISRNYINLRYRLLPLIYSKFWLASQNGTPIQKSLVVDYTHDEKVFEFDFENQYLFCESFMIVPTESSEKVKKFYVPKGNWYNLTNDEKSIQGVHYQDTPIDRIPLLVRESSIIPMQSVVQSTKEKPEDTLEIHLYKGELENSLLYYEDDGETYNYETGSFYKREMSYSPLNKTFTITEVKGTAESKFKSVKLMLHGFDTVSNTNGEEDYSFLDDLPEYDAFYVAPKKDVIKNLQFISFDLSPSKIDVDLNEK